MELNLLNINHREGNKENYESLPVLFLTLELAGGVVGAGQRRVMTAILT